MIREEAHRTDADAQTMHCERREKKAKRKGGRRAEEEL